VFGTTTTTANVIVSAVKANQRADLLPLEEAVQGVGIGSGSAAETIVGGE
jgi:hypothetical protein